MSTGSLQLGGNLSVAVGPLGRSGEVSGSLSTSGNTASLFSYSKSKGLYGGVSVEGTILVDRLDANAKAYGRRDITSRLILTGGNVDMPDFARPLVTTIERLTQSGGSVGAGLDGDFRDMGIGGSEEGNGRRDSTQSPGEDGDLYDDYGYPAGTKASKKINKNDWRPRNGVPTGYNSSNSSSPAPGMRSGSNGRHDEDDEDDYGFDRYSSPSAAPPPNMSRQWSDQDRQHKRENETRNVGEYVFGGRTARNENDPFAEEVAGVGTTGSFASRMSPSFSRRTSRSNSNATTPGLSTDYGKDSVPGSSSSADRPKHHRKGSSFSFKAMRKKTPPPFIEDEAPVIRSSSSKPTAPRFPTNFNNHLSSSSGTEDEERRAPAGASASAQEDPMATVRPSKYAGDRLSWDDPDGGQDRERFMDEFDRELQQGRGSAGKRQTSVADAASAATAHRSSPVSHRKQSGSRASTQRSSTPTWARNLQFNGGAEAGNEHSYKGSIDKSTSSSKSDPFSRIYGDAAQHNDLIDIGGTNGIAASAPPAVLGGGGQVVASFDFGAAQAGDLSFKRGDVIDVLRRTDSREDWWQGQCRGRTGTFPANYTEDI